MMVEDEPDIQTIAKLALETLGGFTVQTCNSGKEALQIAPVFIPDLILLDVMMPEMDGPTTLQALRGISSLAATPIIFMTAKVQTHEIAQYIEMGATGVIPKPFDPMTLADSLRSIWKQANSRA